VEQYGPALPRVEEDALTGCLDKVGQPVLAPQTRAELNCIVDQTSYLHPKLPLAA